MTLPTTPTPRAEFPPERARVLVAGPAKAGKSTLAAGFLPQTSLIIDTQHGTDLLDGEHYVKHVASWTDFASTVDALVKDPGHYTHVVIDLVSDVWRWCDIHHAGKNAPSAAASNDFQNSIRGAETVFTQKVGELAQTSLGLWFVTHSREKQDGDITRHQVSLANKAVDEYLRGVVQYVWLLERRGPSPHLVTEPSAKFEAGGRTHVAPGDPDPRRIWLELDKGLNPSKYTVKNTEKDTGKVAA